MSKQNDKELDTKTLKSADLYYRKRKETDEEYEQWEKEQLLKNERKIPKGEILCDDSWEVKRVLTPEEVAKERDRVDEEVRVRSYYR